MHQEGNTVMKFLWNMVKRKKSPYNNRLWTAAMRIHLIGKLLMQKWMIMEKRK